MANGMRQLDGIDFQKTFTLVIELATIHLILLIAISSGWGLKQLDVSNAFLHDVLGKVFMC